MVEVREGGCVMVPQVWVWQYLSRESGREIGSPRVKSREFVEAQMSRLLMLVAFNTETGEVVYSPR